MEQPQPNRPDYEKRSPHPHPLTLRPKELADRLGVTVRHVHRLVQHPNPEIRLPKPFKIGGATFWLYEDVLGWIERQAERNAA